MQHGEPNLGARLFALAARPLSLYWLVIALLLLAGLAGSIATGAVAWEAFAGAAVIAGVVRLLAHVQGVPAWPWSAGERAADDVGAKQESAKTQVEDS